jgi:hypothetical protein
MTTIDRDKIIIQRLMPYIEHAVARHSEEMAGELRIEFDKGRARLRVGADAAGPTLSIDIAGQPLCTVRGSSIDLRSLLTPKEWAVIEAEVERAREVVRADAPDDLSGLGDDATGDAA